MENVSIPDNLTREEKFKFLKENKNLLISQKKSALKKGDGVRLVNISVTSKGEAKKGAPTTKSIEDGSLEVTSVINTTNIMDSHSDVHIPGLWKKSLMETKEIYLLQEHEMSFKGIISDDVRAFTKTFSWKDLGLDQAGDTQALIFVSRVSKDRNDYMFDQYKKEYVKNHSVGMQYVTIYMAIDSDSEYYEPEKNIWDKYIDQIVNKDDAIEQGYFWVVTEAKVIEGSAVPIGSNRITPTLSSKEKDTPDEPTNVTPDAPSIKELDFEKAFNKHPFFNIKSF